MSPVTTASAPAVDRADTTLLELDLALVRADNAASAAAAVQWLDRGWAALVGECCNDVLCRCDEGEQLQDFLPGPVCARPMIEVLVMPGAMWNGDFGWDFLGVDAASWPHPRPDHDLGDDPSLSLAPGSFVRDLVERGLIPTALVNYAWGGWSPWMTSAAPGSSHRVVR